MKLMWCVHFFSIHLSSFYPWSEFLEPQKHHVLHSAKEQEARSILIHITVKLFVIATNVNITTSHLSKYTVWSQLCKTNQSYWRNNKTIRMLCMATLHGNKDRILSLLYLLFDLFLFIYLLWNSKIIFLQQQQSWKVMLSFRAGIVVQRQQDESLRNLTKVHCTHLTCTCSSQILFIANSL